MASIWNVGETFENNCKNETIIIGIVLWTIRLADVLRNGGWYNYNSHQVENYEL